MRWDFAIPREDVERAYSLFVESMRREPGILEFAAYFLQIRPQLERLSTLERIQESRGLTPRPAL